MITVIITDITWERVLLSLWVEIQNGPKDPMDFYLVNEEGEAKAKFEVEYKDPAHCCLTINVTNKGNRNCIGNGIYSIYAYISNQEPIKLKINEKTAAIINTKTRYMLHGTKGSGMCIYFSLEEARGTLYPQIQVIHAIQQDYYRRTFIKQLIYIKNRIKRNVYRFIYKRAYGFFHFFPHKTHVLFMSEQNTSPNANFVAVEQRMKERSLDKNFVILHSFRSSPVYKYSYFSWFCLAIKLAKSDVIFVDDYCPVLDWLRLKSDTKLIQLWHAGAGYKTVGYSRWGYKNSPPGRCCHRKYTYCIAPSKNTACFFWEQFGINPEQVLPTGMPRMDKYLNAEYRSQKTKEIYKMYPQLKGKKVILFAPTYRGDGKWDAYYPYEKINFEKLYEFCGETYITIFRMHPWVKDPVPIKEKWKSRFIDANNYPDIDDLFYVADIFITDYSSGIFEYSVMHKPALFYAFDEIEYSYSRGFHRSYRESTPGKICHAFDELLHAIQRNDFEFEKMEKYVAQHFDNLDGGACDRVIDWCLLDKLPQEYLDAQQKRIEDNEKLKELQFPATLIQTRAMLQQEKEKR